MLLQSLIELVETLRERIEKHGDALRASEALTRYALINPLLHELGWDTTDLALVIPEYNSGNGPADYALLDDGKPVMIVEAKKLGDRLDTKVLSQVLSYCMMEGTDHFSVTNGRTLGNLRDPQTWWYRREIDSLLRLERTVARGGLPQGPCALEAFRRS